MGLLGLHGISNYCMRFIANCDNQGEELSIHPSDSRHFKYERDARAHDDECVHQVPDVAQVRPGVRDHAKVDYLRDIAKCAS